MIAKLWMVAVLAGVVMCAAACASSTDVGITVVPGTWSYSLSEGIPTPGGSCTATGNGTVTVASDGTYSITFPALSCSGCTMTASTVGTITSLTVSGSVAASIGGSGCSNQQPTPNPASVTGECAVQSCAVHTADGDSFNVSYTLTSPAVPR